MKVNLNRTLPGFDGKPIRFADSDKTSHEATLKECALEALGTPLQGDENISGVEKIKMLDLAIRIHGGSDDLLSDEITLLKVRVNLRFVNPLVVGSFCREIERTEEVTRG